MSRQVIVRPPAKVNLTLRVGALGPDGRHAVQTLIQSISLSDTLTVSPRSGPFALSVRAPGVPADESNLVWRAAATLWKRSGRTGAPRDAHVRLEKAIPTQAGLGGGSADAAAALVALNVVWGLQQTPRHLAAAAAELGSDVPFFLQGGTAVGIGRGDEIYPVDDIARFGVVVVKPSFGVSTREAYGWLDEDRAAGVEPSAGPAQEIDVGWPTGPVRLANDLQATVARRHPGVAEMVEACRREGALAAGMTGSGSAVFGLFRETTAKIAAGRLRRPDWLVLLGRTLTRREAARKVGL
ncbi:MAG TPA: 4-(cytidine 5'-diphospho)-2-C-methyl-D-erythritol kinase [Vicinamibacterales bacterium]|nr:4-(cytidine 5'-diphospho)-2-C-methyl-D-erythritol kinase [Vicinamibacterales bacterium]